MGGSPGADPDLVDALVEQLQALAPGPPPAPEEERRRDWAGGLPAEVLGKVAEKLTAAETRGPGSTLLAITCKGWKEALKQNAIARAGGPEVWRDWGNRFEEGLPAEVLGKIAEKRVAQSEAGWAAQLKMEGWSKREIQREMAKRKREGNCLLVFARVCKEWRQAQLKVGGPLRTRVKTDVILPGSVELAKWALAEGCHCPSLGLRGCPREGQFRSRGNMATVAAFHGHLELVKWLCGEGGFTMDTRVMNYAALSGNLALVQWLWDRGCPLSVDANAFAAEAGHLEVLRWLRAQGAPWCATTCEWAARGGHLETLRWARENGCEWDKGSCWQAAGGGHLEVLQWLRAEDCPWCWLTCYHATSGGHREVLRWARENGCPWHAETRDRAAAELGYADDLGNLVDYHGDPVQQ